MDSTELKRWFDDFLSRYDVESHQAVWQRHRATFLELWQNQILGQGPDPTSQADYDPIIRLLDINARGFRKDTDEAVARVGLRQGTWYRIFNNLREKENIRRTLNDIFRSHEDAALIALIDRLFTENERNKNGLTGRNANALNALLFLNNPDLFISSVSLSHRFQVIKAFDFGDLESYKTYGEKVIRSSRDIIAGFREKFSVEAAPRTISEFLYFPPIASYWKKEVEPQESQVEVAAPDASQAEFAIEKHLEDFLVANWEATELGRRFDLIEENGEIVSQQYRTDIGLIDLLVKDKRDGTYTVIELKKGQTSDDTVGQLARYMGWLKKHKASGAAVRGIVIAGNEDKRLKYALLAVPETELLLYRVNFVLQKPAD